MNENTAGTNFSEESIVSDKDFPERSSRLQELLNTYTGATMVPTVQKANNPLANVKVKMEAGTRNFDKLTEEEKKMVMQRVAGVDYHSAVAIQNFGSAKSNPMTKQAEQIISNYTADEVGEIAEPMIDLVATIKSHNPQEIVKRTGFGDDDKVWGTVSSMIGMMQMRSVKKKMYKALAEHKSIEKCIQDIEVELKKQQLSLQKDITIYEEMCKNSLEQVREFEYDCIALQLMLDDVTERQKRLTASGEVDLTQLNEVNSLQSARDRLYRKIASIQTVRVALIQSIPQLSVLIGGNEIICEKINEVDSLIIPLWKWQYAIAIGAIQQKEAISIQKAIRGVTSKLLTGNAKMLHDNMIAAQEELYAVAVAVEDMLTVQDFIDDMVTKVNQKRSEVIKKSVETMKICKQIEQRNYDLMTQRPTNE